jgi:hypothetical protein
VVLAGYYLSFFSAGEPGKHGNWRWLLLVYLGVAAGILLKGPIAVLLPGAVMLVHLLAEGKIQAPWQPGKLMLSIRVSGLWWGIPLVAGLVLPWFLWANNSSSGEFFRVFFWHHNIERGLGEGILAPRPWWFYGVHFLADMLPWSLLLPAACWVFLRPRQWRLDPEARFGLIWFVSVTVLLSFFRFKRADYLLPAYPGAALFLASVGEKYYRSASFKRGLAAAFSATLALCVFGWWGYVQFVLPAYEPALESRTLAGEVRRRAPSPQLILFFRTEAHALAFHIGRPIDTILEWENLDAWVGRPEVYHILMPAPDAAAWRQHLKSGRLEEIMRVNKPEPKTWLDPLVGHTEIAGTLHAQPLVLMRSYPGAPD